MKVCFEINDKTEIQFHGEEVEPEIAISTDSDIIEIFGTKESLKVFATNLYNEVNNNEVMVYANTLKRIIDTILEKDTVFYSEGEWYSRYHGKTLTVEELSDFALEITQP